MTKFTEVAFKRSGSLFPQITRHVKRKTVLTVFNIVGGLIKTHVEKKNAERRFSSLLQ